MSCQRLPHADLTAAAMKAATSLLLLSLLAVFGHAVADDVAAAAVSAVELEAAKADPKTNVGGSDTSASAADVNAVSADSNTAADSSNAAADSTRRDSDETAEYKVVCYYGSWAVYRWGDGKVDVEDIDPRLCTHLIYTFAGLDARTHEIVSLDEYNDMYDNWGRGAYERFVALKRRNPSLKTLLAIGGWNEGSEKYSEMSSVPAHRQIFVQSCVEFLLRFGFDGMDLDWEYPSQRGGNNQTDKDNFGHLVRELSDAFIPEGLLLTAAVSGSRKIIDSAYHMSTLSQYLDIINVMAYDYHGSWDPFTGHVAPLYISPLDVEHGDGYDYYSVNYTVHHFLAGGVPAKKIALGLPIYGQGFTLSDPSQHGLYAPAPQPMSACRYTGTAGFCGFAEICVMLQGGGWTTEMDADQQAVYSYKGDVWVGYDDLAAVARKAQLIQELGLGGGMVWSVETDDLNNLCNLGTKYPFMTKLWTSLNGEVPNPPTLPPPTTGPTAAPTAAPTTAAPTAAPTTAPTTAAPTMGPTEKPTESPTAAPTTAGPTVAPTTAGSTAGPTAAPTAGPTTAPTVAPTGAPTTNQPYHICNQPGLNPDPTRLCSPVFYECEDIGGSWRVTEMECAGGLVFDRVNHVCSWPQQVEECN